MYKLVLLRHGESEWNRDNRFTGWTDVDLSQNGIREARNAGQVLFDHGFEFDVAFTSMLKRAIRTLWIVLDRMGLMWIPIHRSWRLNERHYGALQGLCKAETREKYGEEQVRIWRRSYDVRPPVMDTADPRFPSWDRRYAELSDKEIPRSECLKDTVERFMPYWNEMVVPNIQAGKRVILVSHGHSLRALVKQLDGIGDEDIMNLKIPTGVPLLYELDANMQPIRREYLGDPRQVRKAVKGIGRQTRAMGFGEYVS